jgi:hypothetical protein
MAAGVYNFKIEQGATFRRRLTVKDGAGVLLNFSGFTARMHIRPELESSTIYATLTTSNGGITLGGAAGTIDLYLSSTSTKAVLTDGLYDLELVSASNEITRVIKGKVWLDPEVTRE